MNEEQKKIICLYSDTIDSVFSQMDQQKTDTLFVTDQQAHICGKITKTDLRTCVQNGIPISEKVEKAMNRTVPFLIETEIENEFELKNKLDYLRSTFALKQEDLVPVCNNQMHIVQVSNLETLTRAGQQRQIAPVWDIKSNQAVRNVCVIGGGGYLGTVLSEKLLRQGYRVRIFDTFVFGHTPIQKLQMENQEYSDSLEIYEGDMRSISDITRALEHMDAVVLLGAVVGDPASSRYPMSTFEVNYLSAQMIAETCAYLNINRFLFASTCSVYGQSGTSHALDECAPLNPVSHYARTKINAEQAILSISSPNFAPTIMRMSTLYGPSYRMRYDLVVNTMVMKGITQNKITVFGGKQWRPLLSVGDAAKAYIAALQADIDTVKRQIYNVGDEQENYQIQDLGEMIVKFLQQKGLPVELEIVENTVDQRDYKVSFQKIRSQLHVKTKETVPIILENLYTATLDEFKANDIENASHYNDQNIFASDAKGILWSS